MKNIFILLSLTLISINMVLSQEGPSVDYCMEQGSSDNNMAWYHNVIQTKSAWDITQGNNDVVIVYICIKGVNWEHEKIRSYANNYDNINRTDGGEETWTYWNSFVGDGVDDDQNNVIDDWRGAKLNVINNSLDNNTLFKIITPDYPDGTWLSGIISGINEDDSFTSDFYSIAGGLNQRGITVVPFTYNGLPDGSHTFLWNTAIQYAIDINAEIILFDFTTSIWQPTIEKLQLANDAGIFIIGPSGWNENGTVGQPANINFQNIETESVFSVGGSTKPDNNGIEFKHPLSDYGANPVMENDMLDLVAPAEKIYTTSTNSSGTNDEFKWIQGNAASAAMVAATAGLMLSVNPDLTTIEIRDILRETADKINSTTNGGTYNYNWNSSFPGQSKYCGYGRLNTYQAVCATLETLPVIEVVDGDIWTVPKFSLSNIEIPENYTLTITSTVYMGNDARIIVKPGATLIVDGGTLTNYKFCGHEDNLWKGVEVWGNDEQSQYPCNGTQYQGKIVLQNGATIENAEIGVLLCARDGVNYNTEYSGGIIQISDDQNENTRSAYFINNKYSINFKEYSNYSLGFNCSNLAPADNLSFIKDCKFEINQDYLENSWHKACIYMSDVNGIKIAGCEFANNYNELHGHGINAYNAGFKVYDLCNSQVLPCPEGEESECTFTNFGKGINLGNINSTNTLSVENAVFTNNSNGITLSNVHNAAVLFSDFYIGENPDEEGECEGEGQSASGYGIDMTGCTGFAIEENNFYKYSGAPSGDYTGVRCKDSHTPYDLIYLNTFEGLSYGNFAEGMNRDIINDAHGLEFQCNYNIGNNVDFQIIDPINPLNAMIRGYMGYTSISAGNTFSQQSNVDWHFLNLGKQQIDYWWYSGNAVEEPEYYCDFGSIPYPDPCYFTPYSITYENTCPSHYGGGGSGGNDERSIVLTPQQFQETEQQYLDALNDFNNMKALYDNLKDGGNTQSLESEVETALPSDMWQLRAELLGVSPHVSKDVLMTTAEKTDVFPENILFEILSANPDELKNGDMINFLENKEQPLPAYMIDMLKQIAGGVTYKTILKRQMADFHAKKSQAVHDIIISILADTVMDMQFYRAWLDNLGGIEADKQIIASYIQEGNFSSTQTLLDLIPSLYELTGDMLLQYNDYKSLTEFQMDIEQQNRSILELDNNEIDFLVNLAENSSGTAKVVARNILNFGYGYNYCHCLPTDSSTMKSSAIDFEKPENDNGLYINAEPNPADTWVAFNVKIPSYINEAVLRITDINGKRTKEFSIDSGQGQKLWDIRKIDSGIYFYTLEAGTFKKSGKLIIK